jgi:hypothetical protein
VRREYSLQLAFRTQPCLAYQSSNSLASNISSSITQLGMQAWAAVSALMGAKIPDHAIVPSPSLSSEGKVLL